MGKELYKRTIGDRTYILEGHHPYDGKLGEVDRYLISTNDRGKQKTVVYERFTVHFASGIVMRLKCATSNTSKDDNKPDLDRRVLRDLEVAFPNL